MTHSASNRAVGPPSGAVCAHLPMAATAPVLRSPSPSTSIAATVTVAMLLRPETASAGVSTPLNSSATGTPSAIWSSRTRSAANKTSAMSVSA